MRQFLIESAYNVLKNGLRVKEKEEVLLVTDDQQEYDIIEAFTIAGSLLGAKIGQVVYPSVETQNAEPPLYVAESLASVQAAVVLPVVSITHVEAIRQARKQGTRVLVCSGLNRQMLLGSVNADYQSMVRLTKRLEEQLNTTDQVHVLSDNGTDLTLSIQNRDTFSVDGVCDQPGAWNFAPAGATATAPIEGTSQGTIVFDGSLAPLGILNQPITIKVEDGKVSDIQGGNEANQFAELLSSYEDINVYNIAEFGLGTNEKAKLSGKLIEDERIFGSVHIGIGKSLNIGGTVDAPFHTDGMILEPTVFLDGKCIVRKGKFLV